MTTDPAPRHRQSSRARWRSWDILLQALVSLVVITVLRGIYGEDVNLTDLFRLFGAR